MTSRIQSSKDRKAAIERTMARKRAGDVELGPAKTLERKEKKERLRIEYKEPKREQAKREKIDKDWKKDPRSKVEQFVGRLSAPVNDVSELAEQIGRRVTRQPKKAWGGPAGYMQKNLRDLGMGQKTSDKIKKAKPQPVSGVAIERRLRRNTGKAEKDF